MRINVAAAAPQYVGTLTQEVIDHLGLKCDPGPIYIGPTNIEHIQARHPVEFALHLQDIPDIIQNPDYVGIHPKQNGVEFVKTFAQGIMVSIRLSAKGVPYVRSLYAVPDKRIQAYLQKGTLLPFPEGKP
jgi:hypothetical protein